MSHYTRERSDQDWYRGLRVPETVIRNIDEKTKKAVSGTGGTYTPSSQIVIGGAGLELQCSLTLSGAPTAKAQPASGKVFRFGANDYFKHDALVQRYVVDSPLNIGLNYQSLGREARIWYESALSNPPSLRTKRQGAFLRLPLRIPDGTYLASVEIGFIVGQSHASVPGILPKARVVRATADGTIDPFPGGTNSPLNADGWVFVAVPASGAAWYNGGAGQTHTLTFDYANGDPIDTSVYGYFLEWVDESGGATAFTDSLGNYLVYLKISFYQADMRPY